MYQSIRQEDEKLGLEAENELKPILILSSVVIFIQMRIYIVRMTLLIQRKRL
jgi:hypothetical protein